MELENRVVNDGLRGVGNRLVDRLKTLPKDQNGGAGIEFIANAVNLVLTGTAAYVVGRVGVENFQAGNILPAVAKLSVAAVFALQFVTYLRNASRNLSGYSIEDSP